MKKYIRLIFFILVLNGCLQQQPIEDFLKNKQHKKQIVVEGIFTNERKRQEVSLTYTRAAHELNGAKVPVTGATVHISSISETFVLEEVEPGIYQTTDSVRGNVHTTYTLRIEHEGSVYEGTDKMLPVTSHEKIELVKEIDGYYSIPFRSHQFGYDEPARYDLKVFIPDSLWTEDFENVTKNRVWTYYTHPFFEPNGVFEFVGTDYKAFGNHTYYMIQKKYAISDSYYTFLRALFSETEWRGSLLDSNPGNIPTNMQVVGGTANGGIVGFFAVCAVDELLYKYPDRE